MIQLSDVLTELDDLLANLEAAQRQLSDEIREGLSSGERLRDACRRLGESSSGSWIGWHSRMYFEDYREPPVAQTWNSEWGGIYGYSARWKERSGHEIQAEVERRAGVTLADLAGFADRIRQSCVALQAEVLTILSPLCDLAGLDRERSLLEQLENDEWITSPSSLIEAIKPTQLWSRDSGAISQGMQAPLHINVELAVVSNTSTIAKGSDFLTRSIRLARQVRTKLKARPVLRAEPDGRPTEAPLARRLRRTSITLFFLLAVLITAAAGWIVVRTDHPLVGAAAIVGATLVIAGAYAVLLDRSHATRALAVAAAIGGGLAALEQLLGPLYR